MKIIAYVILTLLIVACSPQQEKQEIRIGILAPTSGPSAIYGQALVAGAEQAARELNGSLQVRIIVEDHKNDPKEAIAAYHALILQQPDIVLSTFSGPSQAITSLAKEDNTPLLYTITFAKLQENYSNSFWYYIPAEQEAYAAAKVITKFGSRVGILYVNIEGSHVVLRAARPFFQEQNITIVREESYALGETDVSVQVQKLLAEKPDILYVLALRPDQTIPSIRKIDAKVPIVSYSGTAVTGGYKLPQLNGTYTVAPLYLLENYEEQVRFTDVLGDKNGYAALGYDAVQMIVRARKNSDKEIIEALNSLDTVKLLSGKRTVDVQKRMIEIELYPVTILDSKLEVVQ